MASLLQIKNYTYTYPNAPAPALADVSLSVAAGECVCVTGHSGCGKTTLLLAIKRLLHSGTATGTIALDAASFSASGNGNAIGIVLQNPESQILCTTVAEEVAFGPENLCAAADKIGGLVTDSLRAVGLDTFSTRTVEQLSLGQKQRLTIASVLSMQPRVLLLDEPTSQLDGPGKIRLLEVLKQLKEQGHALLITEHDFAPLQPIVERFLVMENGAMVKASGEPPAWKKITATKKSSKNRSGASTVLSVNNLRLSYAGAGEVLRDCSVAISQGERTHLFGSNGAGKTSFLRCITGFLKPQAGSVQIAGIANPRPEQLLGKVGFLFQNPQRQLFEETVFAEVGFSLKKLRFPQKQISDRVMETLSLCQIDHLAYRSPLTLSFGEQHRVALASVLAIQPEVLLLDEPFSGLDFMQRQRILCILSELRERFDTTVITVSHDHLCDPLWADRILTMEQGSIGEGKNNS